MPLLTASEEPLRSVGENPKDHPAAELVPRKFEYIDALRGWAFLGVFYTHFSTFTTGLPARLQSFLASGHYGVQLFFMLSAFTLFHSLHARPQSRFWVRDFYLRRFFRIAPMFYVAIVVFCLWRLFLGERLPGSIETGYALTFTSGLSTHYYNSPVPGQWSIGAEMLFYLFVPAFFVLVRSAWTAAGAALVLLIAGPLARSLAMNRGIPDGEFLKAWLPYHAYVFPLGFLLYFTLRGPGIRTQGLGRICLVGGLVLTVFILSYAERIPGSQKLAVLAMIPFVIGLSRVGSRFFVHPLFRRIGVVSYSAYLMHFLVLGLVARYADVWLQRVGPWPSLVLLTVFALPLSVALAHVTHRLVEVPGQRLGSKAIARLGRPRLA